MLLENRLFRGLRVKITNSSFDLLIAFFTFITFCPQTGTAATLCSQIYSGYRVPTLSLMQDRAARKSDLIPQAKFVNPLREIELAKNWGGTPGPRLLQELLPEGMTYINHFLPQANEPGVVKTNSGHMAHVRATVRGIGTNMGVNVGALYDNLFRPNRKSVVREEAKAVVVFIHGGGTKTTGHHVAISLLNYLHPYKVDVVSLDMPWHGEGPRVSFQNAKDYLELIREYVRTYVAPSGKPIILAGHSMGGVISDLYMRHFPKDDLFSAVIPLSTVADSLPGGTVAAKQARDYEIAKANLKNPNIPEGERDLSASLARQNKISPVCGMFCSMLMQGLDWRAPAHNGKDYLPALYIIGRGDALYQGFEKSFHGELERLSNVTLKVYDNRRDIKDRDGTLPAVPVGHLIFDHRPHVAFHSSVPLDIRKKIILGTIKEAEFNELRNKGLIKLDPEFTFLDLSEPETFVLMRNFISKVIGQPIGSKEKIQQPIIATVTQAWANNLVFREFADLYIYNYQRATERTASLGNEMSAMARKLNELRNKEKKNRLTPEETVELAKLGGRQKEILSILNGQSTVATEKTQAFMETQQAIQNILDNEIGPNNVARKDLRSKIEEVKAELKKHEKVVQALEDHLYSPTLEKVRVEREKTFDLIMKQDEVVRILTERYLLNSYTNGNFKRRLFEDLPADILTAFEKYEKLSAHYQNLIHRFQSVLISEANAGKLTLKPEHFNEAISALPPYVNKPSDIDGLQRIIVTASQQRDHLSRELQKLSQKMQHLEDVGATLATRLHQLQAQKAQLVGDDYFVLEQHTLNQVLGHSAEVVRSNPENVNTILQRMWSEWQKIWADRSSEGTDSLY
jgi:pimeloyl-ACP methyl ester carboxylesterase